MNKRIIIIASLFGLLAVSFGAFGAHSLKKLISVSELEIWKTAVDYQFYHTFALLFLASCSRFKSRLINISSWCFIIGILLFCGSLYLLALKNLLHIEFAAILGPITPLGGLFFLAGWLCLLLGTIKNR
jgi:uncharacterized membrane protein YgdD (TMEM256/DUF423 family)